MALDLTTQYPGKIITTDPAFPYGKAQNITTPGDGTGTPWEQAILNDIIGDQQALLKSAGIVPSGSADEYGASQKLQAIVEQVSGRANTFVVGGTANAITLTPGTDQEGPQSYFIGMTVKFIPTLDNTGSVTLNVNGLGGKSLLKHRTTTNVTLVAGDIQSGALYEAHYNGVEFILTNMPEIYETSSFTPVLADTASGAPTYNSRSGFAMKMGRRIFFKADILISNVGTLSGSLRVSFPNDPFVFNGAGAITVVNQISNLVSPPQVIQLSHRTGTPDYMQINKYNGALQASDILNSFFIEYSGSYFAT